MEVMPPINFALIPLDYGDKHGDSSSQAGDLKQDQEEVTKELLSRRDSNGSTGYSTCSSAELLPLSQHSSTGRSSCPVSPETTEDKNSSLEEEEEGGHSEEKGVTAYSNVDEARSPCEGSESKNEVTESRLDRHHLGEAATEAALRCHSAGFRGQLTGNNSGGGSGTLLDNLRRGSNGYHSREETEQRLVTSPNSLGEAITLVIQGLEANIACLKADHVRVVERLRAEQEARFVAFSHDQEETLLRISENIVQTELETRRIKEEAERNVDSLRASLEEVSAGRQEDTGREAEEEIQEEMTDKEERGMVQDKKMEIDREEDKENEKMTDTSTFTPEVSPRHSFLIQDLTSNIDKISLENKSAVGQLLGNLERAKRENDDILHHHNQAIEQLRLSHEAAFEHLRCELEKVKDLNEILQSDAKEQEEARLENLTGLTAKLEAQEAALRSLEDTVVALSGQTASVASDIRRAQSESLSGLRAEVVSQIGVASQMAASMEVSLNERLEGLQAILGNETTTNRAKLEELREALDGIGVDMEEKIASTTSQLMKHMQSEMTTRLSSQGGGGIDHELAMVKELLDTLSKGGIFILFFKLVEN